MTTSTEIRIELACATDAAYAMPLAVMVQSIVAGLRRDAELRVHVLDAGVEPADRETLTRFFAELHVSLRWYRADTSLVAGLPTWGRMSSATYHRLLIGEHLPASLGRVIWLDCDLLVETDLGRLWETDLGGSDVLAVQDILVPTVGSANGIRSFAALGLPPSAKYFNAGVMLVDLDRWRRDDIARRAIGYLRDHAREVVFWDQEALNAVLRDRWGELDQRWNQNASVTGRSFFTPRDLDEETYARLVRDPWIVHFSGGVKPWLLPTPAQGARTQFFEHLDRTPWAGWRPRRTIGMSLVAAYEASRIRNVLYPTEAWAMRARRSMGAR